MSRKNTNHYLLKKPQTYTFDYAKIIYIIFKNCDGKHYFRVLFKKEFKYRKYAIFSGEKHARLKNPTLEKIIGIVVTHQMALFSIGSPY